MGDPDEHYNEALDNEWDSEDLEGYEPHDEFDSETWFKD